MEATGFDIVEKGKVKKAKKGMIKSFLWNVTHLFQHKNRTYVSPQHSSAFSLMELLIVVAIISILAAMLLPALQKAREKARQAVCMSNMKQIYQGIMLYASDYGGYVVPYLSGGVTPTGSTWIYQLNTLLKYVPGGNELWICRSNPGRRGHGGDLSSNYGINNHINIGWEPTSEAYIWQRIGGKWDARTPLVADVKDGEYRFNYDGYIINELAWPHSDGANFLFLDGHVSWYANFDQTPPSDWKWNKNYPW